MKKVFLLIAIASVLALGSIHSVDAQSSALSVPYAPAVSTLVNVVSNEYISSRAIRDFNKAYKENKDAQWSQLNGGGFLCRFVDKNILKRAYYDDRGNWQYTIAGYSEDKLPRAIRGLVKSIYYDYAITYAQEINMVKDEKTVYLIQIEDEHKLIILRLGDGEMEVIEEFSKLK
jgi:hypothetical protein